MSEPQTTMPKVNNPYFTAMGAFIICPFLLRSHLGTFLGGPFDLSFTLILYFFLVAIMSLMGGLALAEARARYRLWCKENPPHHRPDPTKSWSEGDMWKIQPFFIGTTWLAGVVLYIVAVLERVD